jgi:GT2 family glycosyltransferase
MMRIAAVLTCFNRREKTLAALKALYANELPRGASLHVFLTDDGSRDGTGDAIREAYPDVRVFQGDGSLYWNGGMRMAFGQALSESFDYYLWLNDDTLFFPDSLTRLLNTAANLAQPGIVVGSAQESETGPVTYGGLNQISALRRLNYRVMTPADVPVPCDTMNGNCVLIPAKIATDLGNLDPAFIHGMGDFDYGLRARAAGYGIWVMPGFAGVCGRNPVPPATVDRNLPRRQRLRKLIEPKVLPPGPWRTYAKRHGGMAWPIYWLWPYLKNLR